VKWGWEAGKKQRYYQPPAGRSWSPDEGALGPQMLSPELDNPSIHSEPYRDKAGLNFLAAGRDPRTGNFNAVIVPLIKEFNYQKCIFM
jgi:hypothetical protein